MNSIIEVFRSFGVTEWSMFVTNILLACFLVLYNQGALKCKDKLTAYELELKDKNKLIEYYENVTGKGVVVNESTNQD